MNLRDIVIFNTVDEAAKLSLFKISTIEIAKNSGCSEANIFKLFKNKRNLLLVTYLNVLKKVEDDNELDLPKEDNLDSFIQFTKKVWKQFIHYFINENNYCKYLYEYRNSNFFSQEIINYEVNIGYSLVDYFDRIDKKYQIYSYMSRTVFLRYAFDAVLRCSLEFDHEYIRFNDNQVDLMYKIYFQGIINLINDLNK